MGLLELMILSFGGQGGVTAARILAIAALNEGLYAQAIPQFGAERRGALVRSYLRISDRPIRRHSAVRNPNMVSIFSEKILEIVDVNAEKIVVNSREPRIRGEVYYVDASSIALNLNLVSAGWPIVNTAMAGAIAKVLGFSIESIRRAISETFAAGRLRDLNVKAAEIAYKEVKKWNA